MTITHDNMVVLKSKSADKNKTSASHNTTFLGAGNTVDLGTSILRLPLPASAEQA